MNALYAILTFLLLTLPIHSLTAQSGKYFFDAHGGLGISIGPTTHKWYNSSVNALTVQQYNHKRYSLPTLTLRGSAWKKITEKTDLGISAGVNFHYFEKNPYGNYYTALTFPVQIGINYTVLQPDKRHKIDTELKTGYNFQKQVFFPITEKGGSISSFNAVFSTDKAQHVFLIKLGYELQFDRNYLTHIPGNEFSKQETIRNVSHRHMFFVSSGIRF